MNTIISIERLIANAFTWREYEDNSRNNHSGECSFIGDGYSIRIYFHEREDDHYDGAMPAPSICKYRDILIRIATYPKDFESYDFNADIRVSSYDDMPTIEYLNAVLHICKIDKQIL